MLKKKLGTTSMVATSTGMALSSSIFPAIILAIGNLGMLTAMSAIAIAGILNFTIAIHFANLSQMFPEAKGIKGYLHEAFGEKISSFFSLLYLLLTWVAGALEIYIFSYVISYLGQYFKLPIVSSIPGIGWTIFLLCLFFLLNLWDVEVASKWQSIITYGMFTLLVLFSMYVFFQPTHQIDISPINFSWNSFIMAVGVSMYLFRGFEWVVHMAGEVKNIKVVARALPISIMVLTGVYLIYTSTLPLNHSLSMQILSSPVPHLLLSKLFGWIALAMMGLISLMATLTTYNATMMGVSRMIYDLASVNLLPQIFTRVHGKFRTPWVAIVATFLIQLVFALLVSVTHNFHIPILMATIIQGIVYALSGTAIWILRNKARQNQFLWFRGSSTIALFSTGIFIYLSMIVILPSLNGSVGISLLITTLLTFVYVFSVKRTSL
ncbi:APC family permease [Marininema mesophilum]|nr:APC family permease [Marininema mesophilum]